MTAIAPTPAESYRIVDNKFIPEESLVNLHQKNIYPTIQANTTVQANMLQTSGNRVDFLIDNTVGHYIKRKFLKMTLVNSHPTDTITMVPLSSMINRLELWDNGRLVTTYPGIWFFIYLNAVYTDEEIGRFATVGQWDPTTYQSTQVIAANGGSFTYYLALDTFINLLGVPIVGSTHNWMLRIYFNGGASIVQATSGAATIANVTVTQCELFMHSVKLDDDALSALLSKMVENPVFQFRTLLPNNSQPLPQLSVTAGSSYTQILNVPNVKLGAAFFYLIPTNPVGTQMYVPLPVNNLDIQDQSGVSLTQSAATGLSSTEIQNLLTPDYFPGSFFDTLNYGFVSFSSDIVKSLETGSTFGRQYLKGTERVYFTSGVTNAAVQLNYIMLCGSTFIMDYSKGTWILDQSA